MKTYKKIFFALGVAIFLPALSSCDAGFDEINTDPNKPTIVQTTGILTQVQQSIALNYYNSWRGIRMTGLPCQHWTQRQYIDEDLYDYAARTSTISGYFNYIYVYIELANKIIELNDADPEGMSIYGDNAVQKGSARILKAFLIQQNVEIFGDIPYTEANNISEFSQPKYDTQEFIFKALIADLKEVNAELKLATKGWTAGDILFGGDVEKWRKFGNSVRLRLAMRMSNIDPVLSATEAEAAINDGVMESNNDNASFNFVAPGAPNQAPLYETFLSRHDFVPSWQLTNLMAGKDAVNFTNPFNGISDPRLIQFALSPATIAKGELKRVEGLPYGLSSADNDRVWATINEVDKTAVYFGVTAGKTDNNLAKPMWSAFWSTFMDYTNVALFIAEHKNNDRGYFKKGVEASLDMWGVPAVDATAYATSVLAKFDAANDEGKLEMIITQKYIHNFAHSDQEAWTEYRRTEYPGSLVLPGEQSGYTYKVQNDAGVYVDKTYTFIPRDDNHGDRIIDRMLYPTDESTNNKASLDAAIVSMGGDTQNLPLWWSKAYKK